MPLKVVLLINDNVILPVYRLIQGLIEFVKPKKYIWIIKTVMWLLFSIVSLFFLGKKKIIFFNICIFCGWLCRLLCAVRIS